MRPRTFGHRLLSLRVSRGLTQSQLSDLLHVTSAAISRWECGKTSPRRRTIRHIAEIFGVPLADLLPQSQTNPDFSVLPNLGERLRSLRQDHALSVRELATRITVSSVSVWKWEKSLTYPSSERIQKLADMFSVPVSILTHGAQPTD